MPPTAADATPPRPPKFPFVWLEVIHRSFEHIQRPPTPASATSRLR